MGKFPCRMSRFLYVNICWSILFQKNKFLINSKMSINCFVKVSNWKMKKSEINKSFCNKKQRFLFLPVWPNYSNWTRFVWFFIILSKVWPKVFFSNVVLYFTNSILLIICREREREKEKSERGKRSLSKKTEKRKRRIVN